MLLFFEIIIGRPQVVSRLSLKTGIGNDHLVDLDVYCSIPPWRNKKFDSKNPHSSDMLIDPVTRPEYFANVLAVWLEKNNEKEDSRFRFSQYFRQKNRYTIDRLIGAANTFDILPDSIFGSTCTISNELANACESFRSTLRKLPQSTERDGLLGAIGRVGKPSLRTKIRNRAKPIIAIFSAEFPEMEFVIDEAVLCRNYYVHGTKQRDINYEEGGLIRFFADTLEFLFAATDLMEAGWDIEEWSSHGSTLSHPFAQYCERYKTAYPELKKNVDFKSAVISQFLVSLLSTGFVTD